MLKTLWCGVLVSVAAGCAADVGSPDASNGAAATIAAPPSQVGQLVVDDAGRTQYMVVLDRTAAARFSKLRVVDGRFPDWHKGEIVRLVRAVEADYGITATSMRSYVQAGFSAFLTDAELAALRRDPRVVSVTADHYLEFSAVWSDTTSGSETTSWGTHAVNNGTASGTYPIYVLDTGFIGHNDLNVVRSINPIGGSTVIGCYQHSVHVAGIIGAKRNGIGSVGVAPNAPLTSVTVLSDAQVTNGCFSYYAAPSATGVTNALDWVKQDLSPGGTNAGKVGIINMSFNGTEFGTDGGATPSMLDVATPSGAYKGAFIAQSAGNFENSVDIQYTPPLTRDACHLAYPASYSAGHMSPPVDTTKDGIMVVGAINSSDQMVRSLNGEWAFQEPLFPPNNQEQGSNYGACIDAWAPGQLIYSTWTTNPLVTGNAYGYLSGTSMASPHVAGVAELVMSSATPATDSRDLETKVRAKLQALNATDESGAAMSLATWTGFTGAHSVPYAELTATRTTPGQFDTPNDTYNVVYFDTGKFQLHMATEPSTSTCDVWTRVGSGAGTQVSAAVSTLALTNQTVSAGPHTYYSTTCPWLNVTVNGVGHGFVSWSQTPTTVTFGEANPASPPSCTVVGYYTANPAITVLGPLTIASNTGTYNLPPTSGAYTYKASCTDAGSNGAYVAVGTINVIH